jgi:hypothetical protein
VNVDVVVDNDEQERDDNNGMVSPDEVLLSLV